MATFTAILVGIISAAFTLFVNERATTVRETHKAQRTFRAWLNALQAEVNYINGVINEAEKQIKSFVPFTKRMNSDLIGASRLALFQFDEDVGFLERLTVAYGDVVHTNGMLELYQKLDSGHWRSNAANVLESLWGVRESIAQLQIQIDLKFGIKPTQPTIPSH